MNKCFIYYKGEKFNYIDMQSISALSLLAYHQHETDRQKIPLFYINLFFTVTFSKISILQKKKQKNPFDGIPVAN